MVCRIDGIKLHGHKRENLPIDLENLNYLDPQRIKSVAAHGPKGGEIGAGALNMHPVANGQIQGRLEAVPLVQNIHAVAGRACLTPKGRDLLIERLEPAKDVACADASTKFTKNLPYSRHLGGQFELS